MSTRRPDKRQEHKRSISSNPAKSVYVKGGRISGERPKSKKDRNRDLKNTGRNNQRNKRRNNRKKSSNLSRTIGTLLAIIVLIISVIFSWAIYTLNMLPSSYLIIIIGTISVFTGIIFVDQILCSGKRIPGKVVAVFMIVALSSGSFYLIKTNNMLANISSNSGLMIDHMVVAVRIDDSAETIADAKAYNFGVQYALKEEDVTKAIIAIESEVGKIITVTDCGDISGQAKALLNDEVDAVIYNEAYAGIIEEENPEYANQVKVIYTYDIEEIMEVKVVEGDITTDPFCVYISGIDVYGSISKNSRSDVNILAYVNPVTRQILLVTTPRDYYVSFPGVSGNSKDKLTHAGIYGVDTSIATLELLYDTEVQYYARVNFTSLVTMVDALGGVEVYSEQAFSTYIEYGGAVSYTKGMNYLNGEQALAFARERYAISGGDNQRGRNQQAVITAMIQKVISPAIITGATGLITSVSGNVDTDMPQSDMQALIKNQISVGGDWSIKSLAATGAGDRQYCYSYSGNTLYVMQPDMDSVNNIKESIRLLQEGEILSDELLSN